jgi:wyosine [tRNA(Phe)-imidazoG37] synthetase (radical SAM superfamily)
MTTDRMDLIAYGPVPSRRLGHSLGVNNIPPKICSYSCVYCQLGRSLNISAERKEFYPPEEIVRRVEKKLQAARKKGEAVDYLAFVPDGEPTLDINLGREIEALRSLGVKIAVITNASLLDRPDVRADLSRADWVSVKVDAVSEDIWRKVNRPHKSLDLAAILEGIEEFSRTFRGELATETMLIRGINDGEKETEKIAGFLSGLKAAKSYLSIPIRPPAEEWAEPAREEEINRAFQVFAAAGLRTEYLIGYEGNFFAFTGNVEEDLLSITSVHPMREDGLTEFLARAESDRSVVNKLLEENRLLETEYRGKKFYLRRLPGRVVKSER